MAAPVPLLREDPPEYGRATPVSDLVTRVVARNPSKFTYHGTGTYLIGTRTLATQVWSDTSTLAFAAAAPYAALLVVVSLGASGLLFALLGKSAVLGRSASA